MKRSIGLVLASTLLLSPARGDDQKVTAVLDKAIVALGGEAVLAKAAAASTWKTQGKLTINDQQNNFSTQATAQGTDHLRDEFTGEFGGMEIHGVRVLAASKGWLVMNDEVTDLDGEAISREKHNHFQEIAPITILPLKAANVKVEAAGEEVVAGKPTTKLKVTAPDHSTFTLCFDKETGLPVKMVGSAFGWQGDEYSREALFSDYKEMGGIQKATKVAIKRDGASFIDLTITEFKPMEKVPAATFAEPK